MGNDKVYSSFFWRLAERCGAQLVSFIVSIVLARILTPEYYGTVALMMVIITILNVFVDSGLGTALIQKKDADNLDFSTVFFTNIVFCSILYILLFLFSARVASFYGDESIKAYVRVLGLTIIISGIKNIQQAYVSRNMLFKKFFFSTLGGTIVAAIVGVAMALYGYGVWALVAQQVINVAIDTAILWITVDWRPKMRFSFNRLKSLYEFGWKILASALVDTIYTNVRQLLIGKIYSSADLAQYNRGEQFPKLIIQNVNTSIDSVLLPAMSNEQDDINKVRLMTRRSISVSTYVIAPLMMGLAFCGKPLVGLILTEKWLPSVFFMRIFCITYMFHPIHTANLNAIKAMGRSDLFLKLELVKKLVGVIALLLTVFISVKAMAISLLVVSVFSQIINSWPNKKLLNYSYYDQIKDIFPAVGLAVLMGVTVFPIQYLGFSNLVTLILQFIIGVFIYIIGSKLLKIDSFDHLFGIIKGYVRR